MKANLSKLSALSAKPESYPWAPGSKRPAVPVSRARFRPSRTIETIPGMDPWLAAFLVSSEFETQFLWSSDCGTRKFAAMGESVRATMDTLGNMANEAAQAMDLPGDLARRLPLGLFVAGETDHRPNAFRSGETETQTRCWIPELLLLQDGDSVLVICADSQLRQRTASHLRQIQRSPGMAKVRKHLAGTHSRVQETNTENLQQWSERIDATLAAIQDNRIQKAVVSRRMSITPTQGQFSAWASAWQVQQASNLTGFGISTDRGHSMFLGATPETLLKVKDGHLTTHALAGTLVGDTSLERFMASSKLSQEHAFVSDGVTATLAPFTTGISAQPLRIRRSGTVTHLETPLAGQLRDGADPLRVLKALHPTPAIGGWPRAAAIKALETLEPYSRGWFASPLGWLAPNGDAHAAIAIRSQWVNPDKAVMLAGAGIVKDSLPTEEWSETENKFDNMRCVLRGKVHDR